VIVAGARERNDAVVVTDTVIERKRANTPLVQTTPITASVTPTFAFPFPSAGHGHVCGHGHGHGHDRDHDNG
jgi:hypothetical protein